MLDIAHAIRPNSEANSRRTDSTAVLPPRRHAGLWLTVLATLAGLLPALQPVVLHAQAAKQPATEKGKTAADDAKSKTPATKPGSKAADDKQAKPTDGKQAKSGDGKSKVPADKGTADKGPGTGGKANTAAAAAGASDPLAELSEEEQQARQAAERFLTVLEKNPRRGTALDKVYGYAVESGALDELVTRYTKRATEKPDDPVGWMLVGLFEAQRGRDAEAVAAFTAAEKIATSGPIASFYRGQSLLLIGQTDAAVTAFETALTRKPQPTDALDIYQALGRVHQRAQRIPEALAVWSRLEKQFPNDQRVQEQIAVALTEEGQYAEAMPRYKALIKSTKDAYRKTVYQMDAADLRVKLGETKEALVDFENILSELNPENWLYREVRRRIDDVFLRSEDQDGLVKYYAAWIDKHPEDVEAMSRLARLLGGQARDNEARVWIERALKLAPSNKVLRSSFIEQLIAEGQTAIALQQYAELDRNDPNNPDTLRNWGRVILGDKSQPEDQRRAAAAKLWRRLAVTKPNDPLTATQIADLFRQANLEAEAIEEYKRAISLAPDQAQYREYLGEYYHRLKRSEEALATWKESVAGDLRTAPNLARLAEVLNGFGYTNESIAAVEESLKLDGDEYSVRLLAANLYERANRYADAVRELEAAAKYAAGDDEKETILQAQLKVYVLEGTLESRTDALAAELAAGKDATSSRWMLLARHYESQRKLPEAVAAISQSIAAEPESIPALAASARLNEMSGKLQEAADLNRKLANVDRRFRTDYLMQVAKLEQQLGRREEALKAGRDLIAAAPGNVEHAEFFAQMCFRLGKRDEGLDVLRRNVRLNATDPKVLLTLAQALAEQFRSDEAIAMYWQALDKGASLDDKLPIINKLSELHQQTNQFDKFIDRLERQRREPDLRREFTILLAQAHQAAGDLGTAQSELEQLITNETRDTQLLQQLSKLAEQSQDFVAAVRYQQQVLAIAVSPEAESRLANLLFRSGDAQAAADIWVGLTTRQENAEQRYRALDALIGGGRADAALRVIEQLRRDDPNNWELIYREIAINAEKDPALALERCDQILALEIPDDQLSTYSQIAKDKAAKSASNGSAKRRATQTVDIWQRLPIQRRLGSVWEIRRTVGLEQDYNSYGQNQLRAFWTPSDYGQCRLAALGWKYALRSKTEEGTAVADSIKAKLTETAQAQPSSARPLWDLYYLAYLRNNGSEIFAAAKTLLLKLNDASAQVAFLEALPRRLSTPENYVTTTRTENQTGPDTIPPMPEDELNLMVTAYDAVLQRDAGNRSSAIQYSTWIRTIQSELKRADKAASGDDLLKKTIASSRQAERYSELVGIAVGDDDMQAVLDAFAAEANRQLQEVNPRRGGGASYYADDSFVTQFQSLMEKRAKAKKLGDVLTLFETYNTFSRRKLAASGVLQRPGRAPTNSYGYQVQIYRAGSSNYQQLQFPKVTPYFSGNDIALLRQVYECYKDADLVSDFIAYLRGRIPSLSGTDLVCWRLSLAVVLWWDEERESAMTEFTAASDSTPGDGDLRLLVAGLQSELGNFDTALEIADSMTPTEASLMQKREQFALQMAVRLGLADRAREAAERLFGLRLDTNTQVQLAGQMRQLGLYAMADAVVARAQRQAGNNIDALVTVMNQYAANNQQDIATQIAYQILRKKNSQNAGLGATRAAAPAPTGSLPPGANQDYARSSALQVLSRSGRLAEMVSKLEAQLKETPGNLAGQQMLVDYYDAMGDSAKSMELLQTLSKTYVNDAALQTRIAGHMYRNAKYPEACDYFLNAIKVDPESVVDEYYYLMDAFKQAKRIPDLTAAFQKVDISRSRRYWSYINMLSYLSNNEDAESQEFQKQLVAKIWKQLPQQRSQVFYYLRKKSMFEVPEIAEYVDGMMFPKGGSTPVEDWGLLSNIMSYGTDTAEGLLTRALESAAENNRLEAMLVKADESLARSPNSLRAKIVKSLILVRLSRQGEARGLLMEAIGDPRSSRMPNSVRYLIGQEFDQYTDMQDVAIMLYTMPKEKGLNNDNDGMYGNPLKRLSALYNRMGKRDSAREVLLNYVKSQDASNYDRQYQLYLKYQAVTAVATELKELGYPADAVRLIRDQLSRPEDLQTLAAWWSNGDLAQQLRDQLTEITKGLKPEDAPETLMALLSTEHAAKDSTAAKSGDATTDTAAHASKPAAADSTLLDISVGVTGDSLEARKLSNLVESASKEVLKSEQLTAKLMERMAALQKDHPGEFSVKLANSLTLMLNKSTDLPTRMASVGELVKLLDKYPLDELAEGARANARQRKQATPQVALWLVARRCLPVAELREMGETLAQRALKAAARQQDKGQQTAILMEWAQLEIDAGKAERADELWAQVLEASAPTPKARKRTRKPAAPPAAPPAGLPAAAPAAAVPGTGKSAAATWWQPGLQPVEFEPFEMPPAQRQAGRNWLLTAAGYRRHTTAILFSTTIALLQASPAAAGASPVAAAAPVPATGLPAAGAGVVAADAVAADDEIVIAPLTHGQFHTVSELARVAIKKGRLAFSMKCMQRALIGGPPVDEAVATDSGMTRRSLGGWNDDYGGNNQATVAGTLSELVPTWLAAGAKSQDVYDIIVLAVFPKTSAGDIRIDPSWPGTGPSVDVTLATMLVAQAIRGDRVSALLEELSKRESLTTARPGAFLLRAEIARQQKNSAALSAAIAELTLLLQKDKTVANAQFLSTACKWALTRAATAEVGEKGLRNMLDVMSGIPQDEQSVSNMRQILVKYYFSKGDLKEARQQIELINTATQKFLATQNQNPEYRAQSTFGMFSSAADLTNEAGLLDDTLNWLAKAFDQPHGDQSLSSTSNALVSCLRKMRRLPAEERYARLKDWSLPTAERRYTRMATWTTGPMNESSAAEPSEDETIPAGTSTDDPLYYGGVLSTLDELVLAAQAAGKLDELVALLTPLATEKVEGAAATLCRVHIQRGDKAAMEPLLKQRLDRFYNPKKPEEIAAETARTAASSAGTGLQRTILPDLIWTDFVLARAALRNKEMFFAGDELAEQLHHNSASNSRGDLMSWIRLERGAGQINRIAAGQVAVAGDPGLQYWQSDARSVPSLSRSNVNGNAPDWWFEHDGFIVHLEGSGPDVLYFNRPITGSFDFDADVWLAGYAEGDAIYGGVIAEAMHLGQATNVRPLNRQEDQVTGFEPLAVSNRFNHLTIQVRPDKVRYLVNRHLVWESKTGPSAATPWLGLYVWQSRKTAFTNLKLSGSPVVPEVVPLLVGTRLDGWTSSAAIPNLYAEPETDDGSSGGRIIISGGRRYRFIASKGYYIQINGTGETPKPKMGWELKDGVLSGRKLDSEELQQAAANEQRYADPVLTSGNDSASAPTAEESSDGARVNSMSYVRPLFSGESVSYEFFWEPGKVETHPMICNEMLRLSPSGLKNLYEPKPPANNNEPPNPLTGQSANKPIPVQKDFKRGPAELPLRAGEWNRIRMTLQGDQLMISLNDVSIYERLLTPQKNRAVFGFWHDQRRSSSQVRSIELTGNWNKNLLPEEFTQLGARITPASNEQRVVTAEILGEEIPGNAASLVLAKAAVLPPDQRLKFLREWVLPSPGHSSFRLQGEFTSRNPAPPVVAAAVTSLSANGLADVRTSAGSAANGVANAGVAGLTGAAAAPALSPAVQQRIDRRRPVGGELKAPVLELLTLAKAAGELDSMAKSITDTPTWNARDKRGRLAMLALIAIHQEKDDAAKEFLTQLAAECADVPNYNGYWERWGELLACEAGFTRPALIQEADAVIAKIVGNYHGLNSSSKFITNHDDWGRHLMHLVRRSGLLRFYPHDLSRPAGVDPGLTWWIPFERASDYSRGNGAYPADWRRDSVESIRHVPGHSFDTLMFAVPMRGNFEVRGELSGFDRDCAQWSYAGHSARVNWNRIEVALTAPSRDTRNIKLEPALEEKDWHPFVLKVQDNKLTYTIDDRSIFTQSLAADCDPWLQMGMEFQSGGAIRAVQVTGSPIIPEEVMISGLPHMNSWSIYHRSTAGGSAVSPRSSTNREPTGANDQGSSAWELRGEELTGLKISTEMKWRAPRESLLQYLRPITEDATIDYEYFYVPGETDVAPTLDRLACLLSPDGAEIHWVTDGSYERTGLANDNRSPAGDSRRGPEKLPLKPNEWNAVTLRVKGDTLSVDLNGTTVFERAIEPENSRTFGLFYYCNATIARVRNVRLKGDWPKSLPGSSAALLADKP